MGTPARQYFTPFGSENFMKAHSISIDLPMYVHGNGRDMDRYQDMCELLFPEQPQLATFFLGRANNADHGLIYSPTIVGRVLDEENANDVQYALFGLLEIFNTNTQANAVMYFPDFIEEFGELFTNSWSPSAIQTLDPQDIFESWEAQRCKNVLIENLPSDNRSQNNKKM